MRDQSVRLRRFATPFQARLVQAVLDSEGIVAVCSGEEMAAVYGGMPTELGGVDLHVRAEDAPRAFELLAEIERRGPEPDYPPLPLWQRALAAALLAGILLPVLFSRHFHLALAIGLLPATVVAAWVGGAGLRLRSHLVGNGHDWVRLADACRLYLKVRGAAWRIPPAADLETLPGTRRDVETLASAARAIARTRRDNVVPLHAVPVTSPFSPTESAETE